MIKFNCRIEKGIVEVSLMLSEVHGNTVIRYTGHSNSENPGVLPPYSSLHRFQISKYLKLILQYVLFEGKYSSRYGDIARAACEFCNTDETMKQAIFERGLAWATTEMSDDDNIGARRFELIDKPIEEFTPASQEDLEKMDIEDRTKAECLLSKTNDIRCRHKNFSDLLESTPHNAFERVITCEDKKYDCLCSIDSKPCKTYNNME